MSFGGFRQPKRARQAQDSLGVGNACQCAASLAATGDDALSSYEAGLDRATDAIQEALGLGHGAEEPGASRLRRICSCTPVLLDCSGCCLSNTTLSKTAVAQGQEELEPMAPLAPPDALKSLDSLIHTASALLLQLQAALVDVQKDASKPLPSDAPANPPAPLDALALAHDSASLIRAHSTKLSLLIINEPFTPSAISSVVRDLHSGPVPAITSAVQACNPGLYSATVRRELALQCRRVLAELHALLQRIPKDGKALVANTASGKVSGKEGSIQVTAILWSACDDVIKLTKMGAGGLFADKTRQWGDMLKDILEELKEWGEEEPDDVGEDDDDVDDLADQLGEAQISAQDIIDGLMNSHHSIPRDDPHGIRPRLESTLKRLRLVTLLYGAARVRRFSKLPSPPSTTAQSSVPSRLDQLARVLEKLPERFEDLAGAFYELQPADIDTAMDQCFRDALAASELLASDWDGADDAFTQWIQRFQTEIKSDR
ncbi:grap2 and cyclin-D-interacting domain-containing protein [Hirsutella rhossiliensis]|uniref:Grap2 and cyclin-D-interacting domain-containing protein n=1 Tax=Hirsutella rhossiliensis TaxID=111463 RepID=A0A9P8SG54_9HYPO|nr:grap2 and cyclin-D-interacting domain-containing protein [Hirsutella rhossiliensis]KAH0961456.1 grap2 and cyclin-D-interacting domain-containing protein [Hirsutella rhossiliensis]